MSNQTDPSLSQRTADPFEAFRERKQTERLEQKFRSSAVIRCPAESEAAPAPKLKHKTSGEKSAFFDPNRSWIY